MLANWTLSTVLIVASAQSCFAQEKKSAKPVELEVLKASLGVWDAAIEVWQRGLSAVGADSTLRSRLDR